MGEMRGMGASVEETIGTDQSVGPRKSGKVLPS